MQVDFICTVGREPALQDVGAQGCRPPTALPPAPPCCRNLRYGDRKAEVVGEDGASALLTLEQLTDLFTDFSGHDRPDLCSPREKAVTDTGGGSGLDRVLEEAVSEVAPYTCPLPSTLPEHRPSTTRGDSLVCPGMAATVCPRITTSQHWCS